MAEDIDNIFQSITAGLEPEVDEETLRFEAFISDPELQELMAELGRSGQFNFPKALMVLAKHSLEAGDTHLSTGQDPIDPWVEG